MFLHIGKDTIIKNKDIIVILSIESILQKKNIEDVCNKMNIGDKIIDVSNGNMKSLVVTYENKKTKGYITNISAMTLAKRAQV